MLLSRKTIRLLGELYQGAFTRWERSVYQFAERKVFKLEGDALYDFLFESGIDEELCAEMRRCRNERALQDWIMKRSADLGSAQLSLTLAEAALLDATDRYSPFDKAKLAQLTGLLELDGYVMRDRRLVGTDAVPAIPVAQTQDAITALFKELGLPSQVTLHHLALSEEHFLAERWDDSISNSRKVLEETLKEIASALSTRLHAPLEKAELERPVGVRDYLERHGLLEAEEKRAYAGAYGLLSHAGGHPYIARKDQARLLRYVALTYAQFVLLQWAGRRSIAPSP